MKHVIKIKRKEAERKAINEAGIAEFQRIVAQEIDENLLRRKTIKATREIAASKYRNEVVIIGSGPSGMRVMNPTKDATTQQSRLILNLGDENRSEARPGE